ncbi:hypothetical protein F3Y22_tig00110114pilonHSYRG00185 [Hibiscus syriacus]|uniref:Integrase catalytic domain-containing protein n=1 Tax=Hibiscus syriacus TaxID=106335 RepID=A0A6A3BKB8_HIBSY|nr:hypothetical protein F3Y22_tig00110114pilonHSYRG00185 [Hibiscus syriacus]
MYDGTIKVVRDVRYVKGLKKNLLSYGLLDNNASKIETRKRIMKVFRGALVVMKGEKIAANLYMLNGETLLEAEASVASCSSDSAMLWHQKLGQIHKQNRLKFNTSNSRGKSVLELIHSDFTVANIPQQNGVAERMNRTLLERTRAMLRDTGLEKSFWAEAVNIACYLVNRAPSTVIELKTLMEMWTGKPADYSNLHVFGSILYVMYNSQEISKLDPKSKKCKFLGYVDGVKGYRLWDLTVRKVVISRDVIFIEDKLQRKEDNDSAEKLETTQIHVEKEVEQGDSSQGDSSEAEPAHDEQEPESSEAPIIHQSDHPEGFEEGEKKNLVYSLNKFVYGLKQAPRCWYKRFDSFIVCLGYNRLNADPCAYFKRFGDNDFVILLLYVGDILVAGPNKDHIEELKAQLAREFEKKDLGSANKILGMQIHRDRNYKPISTPLPINFKLSSSMSPNSEEERMEMSRVPYASAVRSLMFAMICTRPDIAQAVGVVSRYMANSGKEHWNTIKRILRYIKGTSNVALYYGGSNLLINGYVDSDYARDLDKISCGYIHNRGRICSSYTSSKEAIWLKMLLEELGHNQEYVSLFCNSQSALHLARNPTFHSRTKHIRVQYHFIHEKVEEVTVDMQKIHTKDNIAYFMTKAINADKFTWYRFSCGLSETTSPSSPCSHPLQHPVHRRLLTSFIEASNTATSTIQHHHHQDQGIPPSRSSGKTYSTCMEKTRVRVLPSTIKGKQKKGNLITAVHSLCSQVSTSIHFGAQSLPPNANATTQPRRKTTGFAAAVVFVNTHRLQERRQPYYAKAVAATAGSIIVIAAVFFFFIRRYALAPRKRESGDSSQSRMPLDEFGAINGFRLEVCMFQRIRRQRRDGGGMVRKGNRSIKIEPANEFPLLRGNLQLPRDKSGRGKVGESSGDVDDNQVRLKPLHWDKVDKKNADHSMKSPTNENNTKSTSPPAQIMVLDAGKSQNIAVVLKCLALSRNELLDALNEGQGLEVDTLEKLTRIAPTEEEQSQILDFDEAMLKLLTLRRYLSSATLKAPMENYFTPFRGRKVVRSQGKKCFISRSHSPSRSSNSITGNLTSKVERQTEYITLGLPVVEGLSAEFHQREESTSIDFNTFSDTCSALAAGVAETKHLYCSVWAMEKGDSCKK